MAYIGNTPAENYASFETETFTVSATASYTLSHAVANENEIRLVINGVVQQPGSGKAYTASGTTLTLSSATASGDSMYAVYLGRALQTVNPPNASVGTAQLGSDAVTGAKIADDAISDEHLDPTIITGQTAETSIATDDLILLSDTSASGALKKMTRANFVSGVGGVNTPVFHAYASGTTSLSDATWGKININTEVFDVGSVFDTSQSRYTPGFVGKSYIYGSSVNNSSNDSGLDDNYLAIYFNGNIYCYSRTQHPTGSRVQGHHISAVISHDADDYFELYAHVDITAGSATVVGEGNQPTFFGAYKIIE